MSRSNIKNSSSFDQKFADELKAKNLGINTSTTDFKAPGGKIPESVSDFASSLGFGKKIRSKNLPTDSGEIESSKSNVSFKGGKKDWRVKLSIPNIKSFNESPLLKPLAVTGGLVFPYTPTIIVAHSANYNAIAPIHTNYPYFAYQNSQVDQLVITGDFFIQNGVEANYWVGAMHYLRSCTKMFYGGDASEIGAPPPVVKLNGYGDFVFNDVPVVITNFTIDLPQDVDYIQAGLKDITVKRSEYVTDFDDGSRTGLSWVPSQSLITVTVQPVYSRREIEKFSLQKYVNGGYVGQGKGFI